MSTAVTSRPAASSGGGRIGEIAILGILSLGLIAFFIWLSGAGGGQEAPGSVGSSNSSGPRGTLALYRWLERTGFEVSRADSTGKFPPDADTLIIVNPTGDFPAGQARDVKRWVEEGRTLLLVAGGLGDTELFSNHPMMRELGADLRFSSGFTNTVPVAQPLFSKASVDSVKMLGVFTLQVPVTGTVVLASTADSSGERLPLAAMIKLGKGRVFLLSSDYPVSNEGLGDADNGAFVYNLVQMGGRRVAFDETHHGESSGGDLVALLTSTPWGWALLYGAAIAALYIVWSARRLGPPLPVPRPDQRRPTSEYVTAVAGLFRRARKPGYAAEQYLHYFKRTLSRHAELDPFLTDRAFVQSLADRGRYPFNPAEMEAAINRLRQLEGTGEGRGAGDQVEVDALRAIRDAEKVRKAALGLRDQPANVSSKERI